MIHDHEHQPDLDLWEQVNFKPFADIKAREEEIKKLKWDIMQQMLRTIESLDSNISNETFVLCVKWFADEIKKLTQI